MLWLWCWRKANRLQDRVLKSCCIVTCFFHKPFNDPDRFTNTSLRSAIHQAAELPQISLSHISDNTLRSLKYCVLSRGKRSFYCQNSSENHPVFWYQDDGVSCEVFTCLDFLSVTITLLNATKHHSVCLHTSNTHSYPFFCVACVKYINKLHSRSWMLECSQIAPLRRQASTQQNAADVLGSSQVWMLKWYECETERCRWQVTLVDEYKFKNKMKIVLSRIFPRLCVTRGERQYICGLTLTCIPFICLLICD